MATSSPHAAGPMHGPVVRAVRDFNDRALREGSSVQLLADEHANGRVQEVDPITRSAYVTFGDDFDIDRTRDGWYPARELV